MGTVISKKPKGAETFAADSQMYSFFQVSSLPLAAHTKTAGAVCEHRHENQRETHRRDLFLRRLMWRFVHTQQPVRSRRRCRRAAFWAKWHPGDTEQPGLSSQGHKGPGTVWAKPWGVKSEGNVCGPQSPPSTRHWLTWGHPQARRAPCRLPPLFHGWPRALSPCLFAGTWELFPTPLLFPSPETACSLDPFPAPCLPPVQKITWAFCCQGRILLLSLVGQGGKEVVLPSQIWPCKCWNACVGNWT